MNPVNDEVVKAIKIEILKGDIFTGNGIEAGCAISELRKEGRNICYDYSTDTYRYKGMINECVYLTIMGECIIDGYPFGCSKCSSYSRGHIK